MSFNFKKYDKNCSKVFLNTNDNVVRKIATTNYLSHEEDYNFDILMFLVFQTFPTNGKWIYRITISWNLPF